MTTQEEKDLIDSQVQAHLDYIYSPDDPSKYNFDGRAGVTFKPFPGKPIISHLDQKAKDYLEKKNTYVELRKPVVKWATNTELLTYGLIFIAAILILVNLRPSPYVIIGCVIGIGLIIIARVALFKKGIKGKAPPPPRHRLIEMVYDRIKLLARINKRAFLESRRYSRMLVDLHTRVLKHELVPNIYDYIDPISRMNTLAPRVFLQNDLLVKANEIKKLAIESLNPLYLDIPGGHRRSRNILEYNQRELRYLLDALTIDIQNESDVINKELGRDHDVVNPRNINSTTVYDDHQLFDIVGWD